MTDAELIAQLLSAITFKDLRLCPIAADRISAQAAEIERLNTQCEGLFQAAINNGQALIIAESKLAKALKELEWQASQPEAHPFMAQHARTTIATLTVSATVKDYLTPEDEKQSHEWKCPIDYPGCRKNCGSYGCGN